MTKGLKVFTSNRLEILADELAQISRVPLELPFQPEFVVVQSQGMARWLSLQLAERNAICANYKFPFPNAFAHLIFKACWPELPPEPDSRLDVLVWRVMHHLPSLLGELAFLDLSRYLSDSSDSRKLFQLSKKIAWLFDQYLVYRPELIELWDTGGEAHWQAELWRTVAQDFKSPHSATLRKELFQRISSPGLNFPRLPERISVFGVSALPPF
ncbi:MAG: helicase/exodeoxyribonuclease gamma subunit, partial [Verrucomicrobiales bacterium]|nr:helicase/exodeoxyribonuclease gamma subunit [Verrucomicrobiales bacterium]